MKEKKHELPNHPLLAQQLVVLQGRTPLPQYMSDDYVTMDVPDNMTYEQIDALVETMNYFLENEKWTKTKSRS